MTTVFVALAAVLVLWGNAVLSAVAVSVLWLIWSGALASPFRAIMAGFMSFQWLQASTKIWLANYLGVSLADPQVLAPCGTCQFLVVPHTETAVLLALVSLAAMALAVRLHGPAPKAVFHPRLDMAAPAGLFALYLIFLVLSRLVGPFSFGGLAQPLIVLGSMRFAFAVMLAYLWITERRGLGPLGATVAIELVLGFTGFFSGFQGIFFALGIGSLTLASSHRSRVAPLIAIGAPALILLGATWTAIKPTYRAMLNKGSQTQTVLMSMDERLAAVGDLSGGVDAEDLGAGLIGLSLRLSYVDYLADVIARVPDVQPYEFGKLWGEAIAHVMQPRLLFPNKPILLSDSERTMEYTGLNLASDSMGTSISIGYVGESYIDFGVIGAITISYLLGMTYAMVARHLLSLGRLRLGVAVAVLVVVLTPAKNFEVSNIKLFAAILWHWAVGGLFLVFIWPMLEPLIFATRPQSRRPAREF